MSKDGGCPEMNSWVLRTRLVQVRNEVRAEIERHKWFESEKAGYDIGWVRAEVDWRIRYGIQHRCPGEKS